MIGEVSDDIYAVRVGAGVFVTSFHQVEEAGEDYFGLQFM